MKTNKKETHRKVTLFGDSLAQKFPGVKTQALLEMLDRHDCHNSQDDGCECGEVIRELYRRQSREADVL